MALFQIKIGIDMGQRQSLLGGQCCVFGKILAQGLFYFVRARVLALDTVGVVRIHAAQLVAQLWRYPGARQGGGQPGQVMGLGKQGLDARIRRHERPKLVGRAVHGSILPT